MIKFRPLKYRKTNRIACKTINSYREGSLIHFFSVSISAWVRSDSFLSAVGVLSIQDMVNAADPGQSCFFLPVLFFPLNGKGKKIQRG